MEKNLCKNKKNIYFCFEEKKNKKLNECLSTNVKNIFYECIKRFVYENQKFS